MLKRIIIIDMAKGAIINGNSNTLGWLMHHLTGSNTKVNVMNYYLDGFECDLLSITRSDLTVEYELKRSVADFKKDFQKENSRYNRITRERIIKNKHDLIKEGKRTNRFYFVMPKEMADKIEVPKYAGLLTFKSKWFNIEKRAPMLHHNKADGKLFEAVMKGIYWKYYGEIFEKLKLDDNQPVSG